MRGKDNIGWLVTDRGRSVLNDGWLAEPLRQPLTHQAGDDIGHAAGGKADDDAGARSRRRFRRQKVWLFPSNDLLPNLDFSNISVHRGRESEKDVVLQ
jgi:hypothetical protein